MFDMLNSNSLYKRSASFGFFDRLELVFNSIAKYLILLMPIITIVNNLALPKSSNSVILRSWTGVCLVLLLSAITSQYVLEGLIYLEILISGLLISAYKKSIDYYILLLKYFSVVAITFAIATIFNESTQEIILSYLGPFISTVDEAQLLSSFSEGSYSGLAGEVSYNAFCLSIGMASALAAIMVPRDTHTISLIMKSILSALYFLCIILTNKRSFIAIIPLILVFLVVFMMDKNRIKKTALVLSVLLIAVVSIIFLFPDSMGFVERNFSDDGNIFWAGRPIYWELAWSIFKDNQLFGSGINSYDAINYNAGAYSGFVGAHNSYIQFLSEIGIVGFVMVVGVVGYTFIRSLKLYFFTIENYLQKEAYLLFFSLFMQILFMLYAISGNPFHQRQQLFVYAIIVGIAVCVESGIVKNNRQIHKTGRAF
jgi:O-antigen ligase